MAYAISADDVAERWRPLTTEEADLAEVLLLDAAAKLDSMRPALAALVTAGLVPLRLVTIALVQCVKRVLRNPDEVRQQSIGADGAVAVQFPSSSTSTASRDGLYFLPQDLEDLDRLLAVLGAKPRRAQSLRLSPYDPVVVDLTILPTA